MTVQQEDIARTLRPYTAHAQQVTAQAYADMERLPAVLTQVQRALEYAGLEDTFRLLSDLDLESAQRGAQAYPQNSAQHHALWAAIMATRVAWLLLRCARLCATVVRASAALAGRRGMRRGESAVRRTAVRRAQAATLAG